MTATDVVAHATKNRLPVPAELVKTKAESAKSRRRLKEHRRPNAIESEFGHFLEAQKRNGEIECYGFEEITLRWADMTYTPDYFVITEERPDGGTKDDRTFIAAVYIEIKGAHKWEDSIVKFKAARARFTWATFEMWSKEEGRWVRLA